MRCNQRAPARRLRSGDSAWRPGFSGLAMNSRPVEHLSRARSQGAPLGRRAAVEPRGREVVVVGIPQVCGLFNRPVPTWLAWTAHGPAAGNESAARTPQQRVVVSLNAYQCACGRAAGEAPGEPADRSIPRWIACPAAGRVIAHALASRRPRSQDARAPNQCPAAGTGMHLRRTFSARYESRGAE